MEVSVYAIRRKHTRSLCRWVDPDAESVVLPGEGEEVVGVAAKSVAEAEALALLPDGSPAADVLVHDDGAIEAVPPAPPTPEALGVPTLAAVLRFAGEAKKPDTAPVTYGDLRLLARRLGERRESEIGAALADEVARLRKEKAGLLDALKQREAQLYEAEIGGEGAR